MLDEGTATTRPAGPRFARSFRRMPRPDPHPVLGNFPEWLGMERGRTVLQRLERYAHQCGPLARVPLGPTSIVAVNDADLIAELLTNDDANYKGWTYILTRTVLNNVLLLNGEPWRHGRRLYRRALQHTDLLASAESQAASLADRIGALGEPTEADLGGLAHRLVRDTIAHYVARTRIDDALDPDRARIQHELAAVGMDLQCQPWAYGRPTRWTDLRGSVRRVRAHFAEVARARRWAGGDPVPDVLGGLLTLVDEGEHSGDPDAIADTLMNIFFTAHDVLAASTGWCLWLLAEHPEIQARLRRELRSAGPAPRSPEALVGVDYLGQVVKEGLRLYPGYALFGRNPQRPTELAGYRVPRSALLIVSPYVLHRLPRYWPDPQRFDPNRWRHDPHGVPPPRPEGGYLPFGAGRRSCIASHLAFPAMKLMIARIVERAELRARPGHEPQLAYYGTCVSDNGLPARVHPMAPPASA